jgi:hypothetical protein
MFQTVRIIQIRHRAVDITWLAPVCGLQSALLPPVLFCSVVYCIVDRIQPSITPHTTPCLVAHNNTNQSQFHSMAAMSCRPSVSLRQAPPSSFPPPSLSVILDMIRYLNILLESDMRQSEARK